MKKILHVILISLFSLTIISCAKKSSSSSSDTTDTSTTNTDTTTQMGGSRQGVELCLSTVVTTLAGTGSSGSANGTGTSASFSLWASPQWDYYRWNKPICRRFG